MKAFVLGFLTAAALIVTSYFCGQPGFLQVKIGSILDEDIICLKSGSVLRGWIVEERPDNIFFRTEKDFYSLPPENCALIRKNVLSRYFRDLP
ncbi:MAG: hypothetical protein PHS37_04975 [Candidatus Omnitrophica bacterium]|nr:hypothetical protein [Candidatus Omnitrophota bacterium]